MRVFPNVPILAATITLAALLPAAAADLTRAAPGTALPGGAAVPTSVWAGPYAGLFAGYAGGSAASDEENGPRRYQGDTRGFVGGALAGYQVTMQQFVFGAEAELGYLGVKTSVDKAITDGTVSFDSQLGLYGALAARGGYLVTPDLLVFARAGVVAATNDTATMQRCTSLPYCGGAQSAPERKAAADDITWGGLVGAGVEKQFGGGFSARVDYTYFKFRHELALSPTDGPGWRSSSDAHTLRIGVSRRF